MNKKFLVNVAVFAPALSLLIACSDSDPGAGLEPTEPTPAPDAVAYSATVHRTEGGISHIIAADFGSIGFGQGYASAEDHFCAQSKNVLKFRGRLAEFFGPDDGNLDSDFVFKYLESTGI